MIFFHLEENIKIYKYYIPIFLFFCKIPFSAIASNDIMFDVSTIKARGIDPGLVSHFSGVQRFYPGENLISLKVNGRSLGSIMARFNNAGELCADADFLKAAALRVPRFVPDSNCPAISEFWPIAKTKADPANLRVDITVPQDALEEAADNSSKWVKGGRAGMINYQTQYIASGGLSFSHAQTETGFNAANWVIRSRQTFSDLGSRPAIKNGPVYARRVFTGIKKTIQLGQIALFGPAGGARVYGIELSTEPVLTQRQGPFAVVEGIASSQSVIEVRQSARIIERTIVPVGPYTIEVPGPLNSREDLTIIQYGEDATESQLTVPPSVWLKADASVDSVLRVGVGCSEQHQEGTSSLLAIISSGWQLSKHIRVNTGILGGSLYKAASIELGVKPSESTTLKIDNLVTRDDINGHTGLSMRFAASQALAEKLDLSINALGNTPGYRATADTSKKEDDNTQQISLSLGGSASMSTDTAGSFSLSWARSFTYDQKSTDHKGVNWSKNFSSATLSARLSRIKGHNDTPTDTRFYVSLRIPFGNGNFNTSIISGKGADSAEQRYTAFSRDGLGLSVGTRKDFRNSHSYTAISTNLPTSFTQISAGLTKSDGIKAGHSLSASGSLAVHSGGITPSPHQIGHTFGIASVGEEHGVYIDTPSGRERTGWKGYAVIPSLGSFRSSVVQVDMTSLSKNVNVTNPVQQVNPSHGAVVNLKFDSNRNRRVLASVTTSNGASLPQGAAVFNENDVFITVADAHGNVFIDNAVNNMSFTVESSGKPLCSFILKLSENPVEGGLYEITKSTCT